MVGWESLGNAVASDADQFGGQYLNRISQLLSGGNIAAVDPTLEPIIGTDWTFKNGNFYLNDANNDNTIQVLSDDQSLNVVAKFPVLSFTPDYISFRLQAERLKNKTIDGTENTIQNIPGTSLAAGAAIPYSKLNLSASIVNADVAAAAAIAKTKLGALGIVDADVNAHTSTKITITDKTHLPADAAYIGATQTFTNKTIDANLNTLLNLPTGSGGGTGVFANQANAFQDFDQSFRTSRLIVRDPTNTYSLKFKGPAISADSDFQFNASFDFVIFVDADDGDIIKAKSCRTGAIFSTHATNADVVIQACINSLTNGGSIFMGQGTFDIFAGINHNKSVSIFGSGRGRTILRRKIATGTNTHSITGQNITFAHMTFDGNDPTISSATGGEQLLSGAADNILFFDCEVKNYRVRGIANVSTAGMGRIIACHIGPVGSLGSNQGGLYSGANTINWILNCRFHSLGSAFYGGGNTTIEGCYFRGGDVSGYPGGGIIAASYDTTLFRAINNVFVAGSDPDANQTGMEISGTGIQIVRGNIITGFKGYGISVDAQPFSAADISDNIINNCKLAAIGVSQAGPTLVSIVPPFSCFRIERNICYDDQTVPTQQYGIRVFAAPHDNFIMKNNICFGNTIANIQNDATGTHAIISDNMTFGRTGRSNVTVPASGSPYTNSDSFAEFILVKGGTISAKTITRGGTTVDASAVQAGYYLRPGDALTLTYTVAPTTFEKYPLDTNAYDIVSTSNGGTAPITTNGSTTQFNIAHGLGVIPAVVNVIPKSADARGNFYVTADATNITVIYPVAPPSGSNSLWWYAGVNP